MSKTRGFLLAVAVATMAFTLSCSYDEGENESGGNGGGDGSQPKISEQPLTINFIEYSFGKRNSTAYLLTFFEPVTPCMVVSPIGVSQIAEKD